MKKITFPYQVLETVEYLETKGGYDSFLQICQNDRGKKFTSLSVEDYAYELSKKEQESYNKCSKDQKIGIVTELHNREKRNEGLAKNYKGFNL